MTIQLDVVGPQTNSSEALCDYSHKDRALLSSYERTMAIVRDKATGVARRYRCGAMITGRGGIGKSSTVVRALEHVVAPSRIHNTHLTPRGLFDELVADPNAVHVIEDAEETVRDRVSLSLLRSATAGNRRGRDGCLDRVITWCTHKERV